MFDLTGAFVIMTVIVVVGLVVVAGVVRWALRQLFGR